MVAGDTGLAVECRSAYAQKARAELFSFSQIVLQRRRHGLFKNEVGLAVEDSGMFAPNARAERAL